MIIKYCQQHRLCFTGLCSKLYLLINESYSRQFHIVSQCTMRHGSIFKFFEQEFNAIGDILISMTWRKYDCRWNWIWRKQCLLKTNNAVLACVTKHFYGRWENMIINHCESATAYDIYSNRHWSRIFYLILRTIRKWTSSTMFWENSTVNKFARLSWIVKTNNAVRACITKHFYGRWENMIVDNCEDTMQ
jgi:hypothetical protein